ncbi:MAG: glycogen debranching N-terminal domain-containing protein [Planctomycetota bacterium]
MSEKISILDGNTFVVSSRTGDIDASPSEPDGLFHFDTRYLSRWILTVNGIHPKVLSTDDLQYFAAQFFLVPSSGTVYVDCELSVIRRRWVGEGFHEDLVLLNHGNAPVDLEVVLEVGADFADLFEVKDALAKKGEHYSRIDGSRLVLGYRRERFVRETLITTSVPAAQLEEGKLRWKAHIEPHGEWATCLEVVVAIDLWTRDRTRAKYGHGTARPHPNVAGQDLEQWLARAPKFSSSWSALESTYKRSLVDLAALRFFTPFAGKGRALPAAGLPWFMAAFGRDSIITSLQALPFSPDLAEATLLALGAFQGTHKDDFRDEEPGKILHEVRGGEMTAFEERPHSPYFGSADSTPLWLILLDEFELWTGGTDLVKSLEPRARAALRWIDEFGDRDGDGYIEYERRNVETGLENQCWKDSWNSILFADGSNSKLPRATCEIQGYVYDAKVRCARLAREVWSDPVLAARLEEEAAALKRRFNTDFWIDDRRFFALALDGDKKKVDSLTSNIGHLLWSGIVDDDKAEIVAEHLLGDRMFSGWGVRTMAEGDGGYNPIGYHVGTVWPHDNSIIALGLRRYGFREEAARLALAMLEAANFFHGRLPEAFAGYARTKTQFPVEYPTACSPQAWATGTPLLLLRVLLGLEPVKGRLLVDPAIPLEIDRLELLEIPGRWGLADAFGRGRVDLAAPSSKAVGATRRRAA